jgi:pyruvate kinase
VITATQMLESMVENPRPTRAEASDVANAVFDGTDAVMLSAETATGKYPRQAVTMMSRIVVEAEAHMTELPPHLRRRERRSLSVAETICESVAHAAESLDMRAIAIFTETGTTARLVSKYRPRTGIYAFARREAVCNRLNLMWGVRPVMCEPVSTAEEMMRGAERVLQERGVADAGDVIAVVSGTSGSGGPTNLMRLHVIGENAPERRQEQRPRLERTAGDQTR